MAHIVSMAHKTSPHQLRVACLARSSAIPWAGILNLVWERGPVQYSILYDQIGIPPKFQHQTSETPRTSDSRPVCPSAWLR